MTEQPHNRPDALLGAARILAFLGQLVCMIASIGIVAGTVLLGTVGRAEVLARVAKAGAPAAAFPVVLIGFLLVAVMLQLGVRFFRELGRIIGTVREGRPFDPANASRLSRMGWLSVGAHGLGIVLAGIAAWIVPYLARLSADGHRHYDFGFGVGGGGILLTLILFILARVFRQGAEMRDELEGTV